MWDWVWGWEAGGRALLCSEVMERDRSWSGLAYWTQNWSTITSDNKKPQGLCDTVFLGSVVSSKSAEGGSCASPWLYSKHCQALRALYQSIQFNLSLQLQLALVVSSETRTAWQLPGRERRREGWRLHLYVARRELFAYCTENEVCHHILFTTDFSL